MPVITAMVNQEAYEAVMSQYTSGPVILAGSIYWLSHYDTIRFQQNIFQYCNVFKVAGELISAASGVRTVEVYCRNYYCWPENLGFGDAKEACFWRAMKFDGLKELRLMVRGKATFNFTGPSEPKNIQQLRARFECFFRLFGGENAKDKALPDPKIVPTKA